MEETEVNGSPKSDQTSSSQRQIYPVDHSHQGNPTNTSPSADETTENNGENNNNGSAGVFGPYTDGKGLFDPTSKTTVANALTPLFPLSRNEADKISNKRGIIYADSVKRQIKGSRGLDIKVPLKLMDNTWLMYVHANYRGCLFGIVFDPTSGKVTCSTKSLSTICGNADADAELNSCEMAKMDEACLEYLSTMRFQQENDEEQVSEEGKKFS